MWKVLHPGAKCPVSWKCAGSAVLLWVLSGWDVAPCWGCAGLWCPWLSSAKALNASWKFCSQSIALGFCSAALNNESSVFFALCFHTPALGWSGCVPCLPRVVAVGRNRSGWGREECACSQTGQWGQSKAQSRGRALFCGLGLIYHPRGYRSLQKACCLLPPSQGTGELHSVSFQYIIFSKHRRKETILYLVRKE